MPTPEQSALERIREKNAKADQPASKAPPDADQVLSDAAANQVQGMIIKEMEKVHHQLNAIVTAVKKQAQVSVKEDTYMTHERPHLQETRSPTLRPSLIPLPSEYMDPNYDYRFVHRLKVYKRKLVGYEYVMHDDCPICEKTGEGHIAYGDTILMRIPKDRRAEIEAANREASDVRVGHLKQGFHTAVEEANRVSAQGEYIKSFEFDEKTGKEVF